MKYYMDDYDPIQQQQIESNRDIDLAVDEANEILRLINQTKQYIGKRMAYGYYQEIEFLDSLKSWVEYDRHVSEKQMTYFWHLYDTNIPEKIESGLI